MGNLLRQYRDLETRVLHELRTKVENSNVESSYINENAIKVAYCDKVEIVLINNELIFIDNRGQYQSVINENLEDLIILLNSL
jgi:predicted ribosome-associated RNA-binding protein Tma20